MSERQVKKRFLLLTELIRTLAENAFSYGGGLGYILPLYDNIKVLYNSQKNKTEFRRKILLF